MTTPAPLTVGIYALDLPCPRCARIEVVHVILSSVLTTTAGAVPTLKAKATTSPVDHDCEQTRIDDAGLFAEHERT